MHYYHQVITIITADQTLGEIQITVKTVLSLARGLRTLGTIAAHQPVGLTALAELMTEDKSALQRALATLHEEGWIQPSPGPTPRWELSAKPFILLGQAGASQSPQARVSKLIQPLRDATGETVHFSLFDGGAITVAEIVEGIHVVRTAMSIGHVHPADTSAAGRAILAHMSPAERNAATGDPRRLLTDEEYGAIRARGWAASAGAVLEGSNSLAAAILDHRGTPLGALVISGPASRLTAERCEEHAVALTAAVRSLPALS